MQIAQSTVKCTVKCTVSQWNYLHCTEHCVTCSGIANFSILRKNPPRCLIYLSHCKNCSHWSLDSQWRPTTLFICVSSNTTCLGSDSNPDVFHILFLLCFVRRPLESVCYWVRVWRSPYARRVTWCITESLGGCLGPNPRFRLFESAWLLPSTLAKLTKCQK